MHRLACALIAVTIPAVPVAQAQQPAPDSAFVTTDTMIPMRDGLRLHTIIVAPREERVEDVVGRQPLHSHEESAELFMVLSGVLVVVTGLGLAPGLTGRAARIVATLGAFGLLGAGYNVGRSGGELVYQHGAASAYASQPGPDGTAQPARHAEGDEEGE